MIALQRRRTAKHLGGFTGARLQAKLAQLLGYYYADANGRVDFKPRRRQIWSAAKAPLRQESSGKCAYCEADTAAVAHGDVEHIRPKSEYWWLAYCYDNLAFSCQICNQVYKVNHFPVRGQRLAPPRLPPTPPVNPARYQVLAARLCPDPAQTSNSRLRRMFGVEDADLPHPYTNDPERLFAWEADAVAREVRVVANGNTPRARRAVVAAESVLGLNRTELCRLRWNHYDALQAQALALQEGQFSVSLQRQLLDNLQRHAHRERPFAAMARYFLRQWGLLETSSMAKPR